MRGCSPVHIEEEEVIPTNQIEANPTSTQGHQHYLTVTITQTHTDRGLCYFSDA